MLPVQHGAFALNRWDGPTLTFLQWLGTLERARWVTDFSLTGTALDDVIRAVSLISVNPFLSQGLKSLPITVGLTTIEAAQRIAAAAIKNDTKAILRRDYDDVADRNAIEVFADGSSIGYLPAYLAQMIAPELD